MHHDVADLRRFYYDRPLGRAVQRVLRDRLVALWPPAACKGMTVAGFGFAAPMLRPWLPVARRVTALMPAGQGAMPWPAGQASHSVLCDEDAWPIETGHVDRLILLHALETSDQPARLLDEAFRVLGPGGRMLVMVPNRAGLWAASDRTPFGIGRSYTAGQLLAQTRKARFVTEGQGAALYVPPSDRRFWLRTAPFWERTGARISRVLIAGVVLAELSKQAHAPVGPGLAAAPARGALDLIGSLARPGPAGRVAEAAPSRARQSADADPS